MRRRTYHHGDLRGALLAALAELLRQRGVAHVSLRDVARRAKVSHAAPAHHFGGKSGLLTAFAAEGYERLAGSALAEAVRGVRDGADRLEAVGRGYLRFAVENREQFDLMFRVDQLDEDEPRFLQARAAAFGVLADTIAQCARDGYLRGQDPQLVAIAAWALVHGAAALFLSGRLTERIGIDDPERLASDLCRLFVDAVLRRAPARRARRRRRASPSRTRT